MKKTPAIWALPPLSDRTEIGYDKTKIMLEEAIMPCGGKKKKKK